MTSQLVDLVIQHFGTLGVSMVSDYIRAQTQAPAPLAPILPPPPHNEGCPACRVHRQIGEADALMQGLARYVAESGAIPQGGGGTVPLARQAVGEARAGLIDVASAFPDLRTEVQRADLTLAAAQRSLDGTLTADRVPSAAQRTALARCACYDLAIAAFAPQPPHDPFLEAIQRIKRPDVSDDEAIAMLKGALHGDTDG